MSPIAGPPAIEYAPVPPKIEAVLRSLHYFQCVRWGPQGMAESLPKDLGREFTPQEKRCYDAAISCLTEYFNLDGFGDKPMQAKPPAAGGDDPGQLIPASE